MFNFIDADNDIDGLNRFSYIPNSLTEISQCHFSLVISSLKFFFINLAMSYSLCLMESLEALVKLFCILHKHQNS